MAGFQGNDIVLVEDADGFEVPMRISEVVVIGEENYETQHIVEMKQQEQQEEKEVEPADREGEFFR